jgi:putative endonuclease
MGTAVKRGWCVYVLRCGDGTLYVGSTNDLTQRLALHAAGRGARYTRGRGPLAVAWTRKCADRSASLRLEAAVKRLPRAARIALIEGDKKRLREALVRARISPRVRPRGSARPRAAPRAPARQSDPPTRARAR